MKKAEFNQKIEVFKFAVLAPGTEKILKSEK
jgi:hypothetical protein